MSASCQSSHLNAHCFFLLIFVQLFLPFVRLVSFDITRFHTTTNNIAYEGDAHPSLGNLELNIVEYVCRVGWATYTEPIRIWDSSTLSLADFTTHFSFTINTRNVSNYGNGFAFFLAPVEYQIPPNSVGGYLGLLNSSTRAGTSRTQIITAEFDSYSNGDWDPSTELVGINNNSLASAVYVPWNAGSNSGKLANAWITYNATTKKLSVFWTYDENPVFMGNSSLSYVIDLMKTLPQWVKIGFSARTGQLTKYNAIKSWKFTSNLKGGIKGCLQQKNGTHLDGGGLASALQYLHEGKEQCVLHRDIKSNNVLLDLDFTTKLCDFGVSKLVDRGERTQTTMVVGTPGYLAPLEMVHWYLGGIVVEAADARLENFDANEMRCLLTVGLWCTNPNHSERPTAGQVLNILQNESPLPDLPPDMYPPPLPPLEIDTVGLEILDGSR
ncbi:hypothetical protein Godav_015791 [Gossypium davidsonii]|uniref:Protein kinase domain-containing protein n=1 Tax=Gossypium davidsonii TaxID=34287 RepID=A0A7J8RQP1_GOSDV|nr:hypothetical protein [Gossypium davidsonii]